MHSLSLRGVLIVTGVVASCAAGAQNCGWSHIDHEVTYDASGVWNPNAYRDLVYALTIAEIGGAIWEGSDDRFGKTMWQGIDSEIISGVAAQDATTPVTISTPRNESERM